MTDHHKQHRLIKAMTLPFTVSPAITDKELGNRLLDQQTPLIEQELKRIEEDYSAFKETSLVSRFQTGDKSPLLTNPEFQSIYASVSAAKLETGGLFDPYYQGVYDPTGYVKGWAVEKCFKDYLTPLLRYEEVLGICLNGGGDMQFASKAFSDFYWTIGIEHPDQLDSLCARFEIANGAVATSGFSKRGRHVLQRKDSQLKQVSIIGQDLSVADVWATAGLAARAQELNQLIKMHSLSGVYVTDAETVFFEHGELK
ncbi:FAD:protein FMN transferase [Streptococcus ferus]|uniref:FAD:protein FMN transferase n=1 Tax=Streptococcus ferus TaxID=1345 RepID=UPI0023523719|nr:FAD:protein FMN transferase [Streptococcus ferus]